MEQMTLDIHDGLAYARVDPAVPARGGVVVLHGADSSKENHLDFAYACAAAGLSVIVFDQRGHGESEGALGASALDDVTTMAALLPAGPVFLRGSSMGGFLALAAAAHVGARAVVAICPASPELLMYGLSEGLFDFRADAAALRAIVEAIDLQDAARALGPDLMLLHAEADERVPLGHSLLLHGAAPASRLVRVPGGHHSSVQHDERLQREAVQFLLHRT